LEAKLNALSFGNIWFRASASGAWVALATMPTQKTGSLYFKGVGQMGSKLLIRSSNDLIALDTWFNVDIIAHGNSVEVKINGKTTANTNIENLPTKGTFYLTSDTSDKSVHFRKIEIKELPPTPPAGKPFVIPAKSAKAEGAFATLKDAVAAAKSGDTIEIRGDGPFVTPGLELGLKALRIQAGTGFRPCLTLDDPRVGLVYTNAALVLEGLTIERRVSENPDKDYLSLIYSYKVPLHLSHCRFVASGRCPAVANGASSGSTVLHSEFQGNLSEAVGWDSPLRGDFAMENCVAVVDWSCFEVLQSDGDLRNVRLRVRRNTFVAANGLVYGIYGLPAAFIDKRPDPKVPELHLEIKENVIDASWASWHVAEKKKYLPLADYPPLLPRWMTLTDQWNVYSHSKVPFLVLGSFEQKWVNGFAKLQEWNKLWGITKPTSVESAVRFVGGDLRKKGRAGLLTPADFRLADGSPGKGKGQDGKDLGADVDKVGPGPAYDRWRQTAEYRQWRMKTDKLLSGQ
jgi:hypothetical protein